MKAQDCIIQNNFMITDDGDVVCYFGEETKVAFRISIGEDTPIQETLKVTRLILHDVVHLTKKAFIDKYGDSIKTSAQLTPTQYYRDLRRYIVDEKVPIPNKIQKKKPTPKLVKKPVRKGASTRKDQVRELIDSGVSDPNEIADILGTNSGYVRRLIKQIND